MNKFYKKAVIIQILADYVSVVASFIVGYYLWQFIRPEIGQTIHVYLRFSLIYGLVFILIFWLTRLYEEELSILNVEQIRRIIKGWIIGSGLLLSFGFLSKELSFSRLTFVFSIGVLFIVIIFQRAFFFKLCQWFHRKGKGIHKAIIIGTSETAINLFNILKYSPWIGILPVGFVDDEKLEVIGRDNKVYTILSKIDKLEEVIKINNVEQAIVCYSGLDAEKLKYIFRVCSELGVRIRLVPHFYNVSIQRIKIENLLGIPLLSVKGKKSKWLYLLIKRLADIIFSSLVLVCLAPVFFIFAIFIKNNSSGPVFFTQDRVGKNGEIFKIYKFRTMYVDANKYEVCPKSSEDPRITKFGRFLRRTSLDELAQFINVFKGDMSVVGPRPEMPFIVEKYDDFQRERLKEKPGLTGLWQISYQRAAPIHENIDYDLYYIENQSITMDLAIILNTIFSIIKGIGAC